MLERGFTALKTNLINPETIGHSYSWNKVTSNGPSNIDPVTLKDTVKLISTFRESVGPDTDIILDAACKFNTLSAVKLARAMEEYNLLFLEEPVPP